MGTALWKARGRAETRGGGSETVGSACSCCNSVAGPSQAATDSDSARACRALLPSRGQRGALEPLENHQGFGAHVSYPLNFIPTSLPPRPHTPDPKSAGLSPPTQPRFSHQGLQPLRSTGSQRRARAPGSGRGVGGESEREPPERGGDTRSATPGPLESSWKGRAPRPSVSGRVLDARRAAGAGSERTPSGLPISSQAAKGPHRWFQFPLSLLGVLEATCKQLSPLPRGTSALPECRPPINTQAVTAFSTPRRALYSLRSDASLFPLSSRIFLHSSILYFSFSHFLKVRERCGRRMLAAARFLLSNVPL